MVHTHDEQAIWLIHFVSSLGFFIFLKHSISLARWIFISLLRPSKDLKESYGSWGLITGATDGIGKAFAFQLAKKGLNLVLISRSSDKLNSVSAEIRARFPDTKVKIIAFDFSGGVDCLIELVEKEIKGLDVGVLVNNVGVTYPAARYFHEVDEKVWMNIVRVNLEGTTRVTMAVVREMLERKRGAIVNIGSGAAVIVPSHPLFTIYAATKAYVDQLSRSLYVEYKSYGIEVQTQVPLYVATKMTSRVASIENSSLFVPSPDAYAEAAVKRIGYEAQCTPFWGHSVQWFFAALLPEALLDAWRLNIGLKRRGGKAI